MTVVCFGVMVQSHLLGLLPKSSQFCGSFSSFSQFDLNMSITRRRHYDDPVERCLGSVIM